MFKVQWAGLLSLHFLLEDGTSMLGGVDSDGCTFFGFHTILLVFGGGLFCFHTFFLLWWCGNNLWNLFLFLWVVFLWLQPLFVFFIFLDKVVPQLRLYFDIPYALWIRPVFDFDLGALLLWAKSQTFLLCHWYWSGSLPLQHQLGYVSLSNHPYRPLVMDWVDKPSN